MHIKLALASGLFIKHFRVFICLLIKRQNWRNSHKWWSFHVTYLCLLFSLFTEVWTEKHFSSVQIGRQARTIHNSYKLEFVNSLYTNKNIYLQCLYTGTRHRNVKICSYLILYVGCFPWGKHAQEACILSSPWFQFHVYHCNVVSMVEMNAENYCNYTFDRSMALEFGEEE